MKSLFNKEDNDQIIKRIKYLNHSAPAQWGRMNVTQMLAHCQVSYKITYDELLLKRGIIGYLFGKMARKRLLSDKPYEKNLPTFKQAKVKTARDFHTEKETLVNYVSRMATDGPEAITKRPHPVLGYLTAQEWDTLHYKHIDHHLKQFGV